MAEAETNDPAARRDDNPGDGVTRGTTRMEFFADAVFAIAFTLPIAEIVLPEAGPRFGEELLELWPSYLGYALSSLVIGLYWVQHHFSGALFRTTSHHFLLATLLFLTMIGFIDFPTRAFADHVYDPPSREAGALFYTFALAATSIAWWIKWTTGCRHQHLDPALDPAYVARVTRVYARWTLISVAGAALALLWWPAGLAVALGVMLLFLRPPETPKYIGKAPEVGDAE